MTRPETGPRVSVVIATYNWATVLPCSISSVLAQTFEDFEVLVVGDGCTDESASVVESIPDPRVRWINLPRNTGHQGGPNNEGQRRASGEIVAYLGHDDLWLPTHLEHLVAAIDRGAACAHSSVLVVDSRDHPMVIPRAGWAYAPGAWVAPTSLAVPRTTLQEVGGWRMPRDTGLVDPEADLLARVFDVAGPPEWVQRVTCVKLPAGLRKDVYRARPNREQEYWLDKIRGAEDPEAAVLATVGLPYELATAPPAPVSNSVFARAQRSISFRMRKRFGRKVSAQKRIRRLRRYKGL